MCDQLDTQHAVGEFPNLIECSRQLDAARFAAAACVYLSFDNPEIAAQFLGRFDSRVWRVRRDAAWNRDAVVGEQSF